jgi:hypothetical protein
MPKSLALLFTNNKILEKEINSHKNYQGMKDLYMEGLSNIKERK